MGLLEWSLNHWWLLLPVYGVSFTLYAFTIGRSYIRTERTRANLNRPLYSNTDAGTDSIAGTDDGDDVGTIVTAERAFDGGTGSGSMVRPRGVNRHHGHAYDGDTFRSDPASVA